MRKTLFRWALRLIGPALFVLFLMRTDVNAIVASLRDVQWLPVAISLGLMPFFIIVKAWRWRIILLELGLQPPSVWTLSRIYTVGLFLGGTTPGQSGDFVKALYLRNTERKMPSLLFSIFVERLCDVAAMAVMAFIGISALATSLDAQSRITVQATTTIVAIAIFVMLPVLLIRRSRDYVFLIGRKVLPQRFRQRYDGITQQFDALDVGFSPAVRLVVATMGSALSTAIRIWLLFVAMNVGRVTLSAILGATGQISLLQALPISVSGIGIRDAVLVGLLRTYAYPDAYALALSGLFLLINVQHIIVGFLFSLRYPIPSEGTVSDA